MTKAHQTPAPAEPPISLETPAQTALPFGGTAPVQAKSPYRFTMSALREAHWLLEDLGNLFAAGDFGGCTLVAHPEAPDNNGPHWKGLRAGVTGTGGVQLYIHAGLIFHPDFRQGLYLEADHQNNGEVWDRLWMNTRDGAHHEVCRDEVDYLKCFLPMDHAFTRHHLSDFLEGALGALLEALGRSLPLRIPHNSDTCYAFGLPDLVGLYAFTQDWNTLTAELGGTAAGKNLDNYGPYFAGTRYFHRTPTGRRLLFPYGGVLHSRHKQGGIFLELDAWSNPDTYRDVLDHFPVTCPFPADRTNPGFLKIFLPETDFALIMAADRSRQRNLLAAFHRDALALLSDAADRLPPR